LNDGFPGTSPLSHVEPFLELTKIGAHHEAPGKKGLSLMLELFILALAAILAQLAISGFAG
jgi:hypothetical protein